MEKTSILGIDTSSSELGVALARNGSAVCGVSRYLRNSHSEHIASAVHYVFECAGIGAEDVGGIAVSAGPGSFTGLRVGIAFVKGFCLKRNIPAFPVSSLECAALSWNRFREAEIVCAFNARRGRVFRARFTVSAGTMTRLTPDQLTDIDAFAQEIRPGDIVLTDQQGSSKDERFAGLNEKPGAYSLTETPTQRALACALKISRDLSRGAARPCPAASLEPVYLCPSYTEEKSTPRETGCSS